MIYVAGCYNGTQLMNVLKIGHSEDPERRIKRIQCDNPFRVELMYATEGGRYFEQYLKVQMKDWHMRGEWYKMTPCQKFYDFIEEANKNYEQHRGLVMTRFKNLFEEEAA
jgi:hypothetical protein